eukprot:GDKI01031832.1.p2 GENE.GDKI01031832.1~~GDKI01031832.1.p2  ORF type:complete len:106 (-),score=28.64 GDKI01031832.1:112-429(-)
MCIVCVCMCLSFGGAFDCVYSCVCIGFSSAPCNLYTCVCVVARSTTFFFDPWRFVLTRACDRALCVTTKYDIHVYRNNLCTTTRTCTHTHTHTLGCFVRTGGTHE